MRKRNPIRFEAGRRLSKAEKDEVLRSLGDSYKDFHAPKVFKGIDRISGDPRYGYEYNPDYMYRSDITGRLIRHYIVLPDGRKAHPTEIFPNVTKAEIDKHAMEREHAEAQRQSRERSKENRIADNKADANEKYKATGRKIPGSYFAQNEAGRIVRVDGTDAEDVSYYKARGFKQITSVVNMANPSKQSKGKTALKKTGRALKGFAQGALSSAAQILGAGAEALNPKEIVYKAEIEEDRFRVFQKGHPQNNSGWVKYNSHSEPIRSKAEARREAAHFIKLLREGVFTLRNPRGKHLPGLPAKAQREYEHVLKTELAMGRSLKRAKSIAAGKVRKDYARNVSGRVRFVSGEYKGMTGIIQSIIQKRYSKEPTTYRIQVDGFPKPGGWSGKVTATESQIEPIKTNPKRKPNKTVIRAGRIDHLDVSKVHNPKKRKRAQTKNPKRGSYREPPFTGSFGSVPINRKFRIKKGEEDLVSLADIGPIFTNTNIRGQAKDKDGYIRHFPLWTAVELVNPSRRRNADRKDSDHPIEVTKHWRAGPPGYLTPWQRAHHAGQSQLFETGIKPAKRRNASKEEHDFYNKMLAILSRDPHDSHAKGAAQMAGKRLGFTPARIAKDIERAKGAKRNAARTISAKPSKTRRARASSKTGHKKTTSRVRSVAKSRKAPVKRASNKSLKKSSRVGKRRNVSDRKMPAPKVWRVKPTSWGGVDWQAQLQPGDPEAYKRQFPSVNSFDDYLRDYFGVRFSKKVLPVLARSSGDWAGEGLSKFLHANPRKGRRNPSAESIRKTFAGSVNGERDLFFPQGTPSGKLAKLGKLVSITTEAGTIKPVHGTAWLCADTRGKLHIGATSNSPLYSGPARNFGHVTKLEYESSKPHLGYGPTIWFHKAGEENGIRPTLRADGKGGLVFRGGAYRLTERGIEN